ncbi:MAG: iron-containing alcohol dehydrogenase [Promethearchaeota archaeon]
MILYKLGQWAFKKLILKKIFHREGIINEYLSLFDNSIVISSPSAWNAFKELYHISPPNLILNAPLQINRLKNLSKTMNEDYIIGIGGGKVMDCSKALATFSKKKCYLIPSILSTTAWLNPTASLKDDVKVVHAKGRFNAILLDGDFIAKSPQHLNLGGLADILAGYNAMSDWINAHTIVGERLPKGAQEKVIGFCNKIRYNLEKNIPITPSNIKFYVEAFKEVLGLCWGFLSGRPVEGSEHFLYYALEEKYNKSMNHGAIIALNTLACLYLRGDDALIDPNELKSFYKVIKIPFELSKQGIPERTFKNTLISMPQFVTERGLPYSIWNQEVIFENLTLSDLLNHLKS